MDMHNGHPADRRGLGQGTQTAAGGRHGRAARRWEVLVAVLTLGATALLPAHVSRAAATTGAAWQAALALPDVRQFLAAATGADGSIYAIGGAANDPTVSTGTTQNTVYRLAPGATSWQAAPALPAALDSLAAATGADGSIYAIGGFDSTNPNSYALAENSVYRLAPGATSWQAAPALPAPRSELTAATGADGSIYAIGGDATQDMRWAGQSTVDRLAPGATSWQAAPALPTALFDITAATGADGSIYAIGGQGNPETSQSTVYRLAPGATSWQAAPALPAARGGLAAATGDDGTVYAIGGSETNGVNFQAQSSVYTFNPATLTLSSSANPNAYYQQPTFTATITPAPLGGAVTFTVNGYSLCNDQPLSNGVATCTEAPNNYLSVGVHTIVASYVGSRGLPSSSVAATLTQATQAQANVSVSSSANPVISGQPVTLTAMVAAYGSPVTTPTGPVTFYSDGKPLASALLATTSPGNAQASVSTTALPLGTHAITATYQGDGSVTSGASSALSQVAQGGELNDTAPGIIYSGSGWRYYAGRAGDYQGDVHATTRNGDSFTYTFYGTGGAYIAEKDRNEGHVGIYIDGAYKGTVNCWAPAYNVPQQVIYRVSGLPPGRHTFKAVKLDSAWMLLDALKIQ